MGLDGVEKFVATPELQSEDSIGPDPLEHGQVWAISQAVRARRLVFIGSSGIMSAIPWTFLQPRMVPLASVAHSVAPSHGRA